MRSCLVLVIAACGSNPVATDAHVDHGDAPSGVDAAPVTPEALPGMLMWFDAASGMTSTAWADRSGNGRDISCTAALAASTIHTQPAAHFGGTGYCQLATNIPTFAADDGVLVAVVAAFTQGGGLIGDEGGSATTNLRFSAGSHVFAELGTVDETSSSTTTINDGQPHVFVLARQANIVKLRVDGVEQMSIGVNVPSVVGGVHVYVGYASAIEDIGEIELYRGPISADQISGLETYLAAKYR